MDTYFMFGKYSTKALEVVSAGRTEKAVSLIENFGGETISIYALLGDQDLVFIVRLPGIEQALKVSAALNKLTGVSFSTSPAVVVEDFDRLISEL